MLEEVDNLLKIYRSIRPLSSLWATACQIIRAAMMGQDNWATVRDATDVHDVKETLFDISPDRFVVQSLRLKELKLEAAAPYVYDRFIGAWGMFPHHDQVPLYFSKHIYSCTCTQITPAHHRASMVLVGDTVKHILGLGETLELS